MFVDDEQALRDVGVLMLESIGCSVRTASDGLEALELLEAERESIDCVILDMTMPRLGGVETLHDVSRRWPDLPVILASGYQESEVGSGSGSAGEHAFLKKPYSTDRLRAALTRALGESASTHLRSEGR